MAALIAVDPREPLIKVTAVDKAFEGLRLYRPVDQSGRIEFIAESTYTPVQGTYPRVARPCASSRCLGLHDSVRKLTRTSAHSRGPRPKLVEQRRFDRRER
jgi:hypothetical protein